MYHPSVRTPTPTAWSICFHLEHGRHKTPKNIYLPHCRNHVRAVLCHPCSNRCHALMCGTCGPRSPTGWTSPMTNRCPSTLCAHRMGPIRRAERCFCARPGASARASIRKLGQAHFQPNMMWPIPFSTEHDVPNPIFLPTLYRTWVGHESNRIG